MAPATSLDVEGCLAKLSKDDKVALLSGANMWHTHKVESLGIPPLRVSDGPNGIRGIRFFNGAPSNCFPCATGLAASWDQDLLEEIGRQFGRECRAKGAHLWLGPTLNMQRSPLGGRGFESFSEDPLLSGRMSASIIRGVQSEGVSAFPKHFVCNDQETDRHSNSSEVSMRALREIYLKAFQICIKEGQPWGLMTSYNRVNGIHVPEHPVIMNEILRDEWKFDGTVMSDWYGTYSTVEGVNATVDLEMPGPSIWRQKALLRAVNAGKIEESVLDGCVRRMLTSIKRAIDSGIEFDKEEDGIDTPETRALLLKAALESIVLIKNEGDMLPLSSQRIKKLAVIGPNAKEACISGGGSASLKPYYAISPLAGILEQAKEQGIEVTYCAGVHTGNFLPLIQDRVESPKTGAGRMDLAFFAQNPVDASIRPVHEKSVDSSYNFMLDNIPFDVVPRQCWMRLTTTFIPDETGEWDFGLTVAGQAELFIDNEVVVSNVENQRPADTFFSNGSQEEIGRRHLQAGNKYELRMEWSNFKKVNPKVAFATFGGFRIGARKFTPADDLISEALRISKESDAVVFVTGLNADYESEGFDREDMKQPRGVDDLIYKILDVNKSVCIVAQSGTQTEMPWADKVPSLAQAFYGGNESGRAIAHVLFGKHNPSGKLPLSFPKKLHDFPSHPFAPGRNGYSYYTDDVFMGYRGMLMRETQPMASFGHGLSYTTFEIANLTVNATQGSSVDQQTIEVVVTASIQNTGSLQGQEVLQVYVSPPAEVPLPRPVKELAGFKKVNLLPGEKQTVKLVLDRNMFSYWDANKLFDGKRGAWCLDSGRYEIHVGTSLLDIVSSQSFTVETGFQWRGL